MFGRIPGNVDICSEYMYVEELRDALQEVELHSTVRKSVVTAWLLGSRTLFVIRCDSTIQSLGEVGP